MIRTPSAQSGATALRGHGPTLGRCDQRSREVACRLERTTAGREANLPSPDNHGVRGRAARQAKARLLTDPTNACA